jgi:ribonuclease P protein component
VLAAANRLTHRSDFALVARRGIRAGRSPIVVQLRSVNPDNQDPPQVGLVVGRAVGSAVVRNKVKRRLRHLAAQRLDLLPAGSSMLIRAAPAAAQCNFQELSAELDRNLAALLRRVGARS